MCGIAGWIDFNRDLKNQSEILNKMNEKLIRRGPDDECIYLSEHAALAQRRLVVVDPQGGRQPMIRKRNGTEYIIIYNGELYNTEDIRYELIQNGFSFQGWSDTEVLLNAYICWGEQCLEKFNGIYAFAIWDSKKQNLFLARDRIGVKPLFYYEKNGTFLFASEIKAILAHPLADSAINKTGLAEIFAIGPARTPGEGVFLNIHELKPSFCMNVNASGIKMKQYWHLKSHDFDESFKDTVEKVRSLVYDSVERQLVSDVPLCFLLSGGLDSSAICAIAKDVYKDEKPVLTFSIDYTDNERYFKKSDFQPDADAPWVKRVSQYLGTQHTNCVIDNEELVLSLFDAVIARDLPGMTDIDSSLLLFSKQIKTKATVGLSGECADEVFGGYPWFYKQLDSEKQTFPWSYRLSERLKLYSDELISLIKPEEYVLGRYEEALSEVPRYAKDSQEEAKKRELFYLNLTRWMPTLLDRKDRMSMYTGLELRVPYCDHRLVEYVWNIPWEMKYYKDREKGLLRQALTGYLPQDALWRKKSPYPKTHNPMFLEEVRKLTLLMLSDETSPILPFIDRYKVKEFALSINTDTNIPWFGQLMNAPQMLAYLLQINFWMKEYKVRIL
ncbi:MAG: asparagine synthase (glutamine-hydrolyzing) [Eubacteriaceae bacterium]|nr:asparagine synthase (glutamine-hydrolyzing) [Eubacteriaceae bacterium]